jgi:hypothetical protein
MEEGMYTWVFLRKGMYISVNIENQGRVADPMLLGFVGNVYSFMYFLLDFVAQRYFCIGGTQHVEETKQIVVLSEFIKCFYEVT